MLLYAAAGVAIYAAIYFAFYAALHPERMDAWLIGVAYASVAGVGVYVAVHPEVLPKPAVEAADQLEGK